MPEVPSRFGSQSSLNTLLTEWAVPASGRPWPTPSKGPNFRRRPVPVCTVRLMASDRKLEHLAKVKMFSTLNRRELARVGKAADEVTVKDGTEIVTQGSTGHEFYMMLAGKATVRRQGRKVAEVGPGDYFGEMALLDRGPRSATVVADGDATLVVIGQREFLGVLDEVPEVARKLLVSMAARLREADSKAVSH